MATCDYELVDPPADANIPLWLQHAAGRIIFEDVRGYAIDQIDPALSDESRAAARKGIDDAVYGLMMVIDGVSGRLTNDARKVTIDFFVRLRDREQENEPVLAELDLLHGEGSCVGFHGWLEDDFGKHPIVVPRET